MRMCFIGFREWLVHFLNSFFKVILVILYTIWKYNINRKLTKGLIFAKTAKFKGTTTISFENNPFYMCLTYPSWKIINTIFSKSKQSPLSTVIRIEKRKRM